MSTVQDLIDPQNCSIFLHFYKDLKIYKDQISLLSKDRNIEKVFSENLKFLKFCVYQIKTFSF